VASELGCIREFAGDVPLYAATADGGDLARQLERLVADPELRASMSRRGVDSVAGLRWPEVGERTARELELALSGARPSQVERRIASS
jgi:hypothetical protein